MEMIMENGMETITKSRSFQKRTRDHAAGLQLRAKQQVRSKGHKGRA